MNTNPTPHCTRFQEDLLAFQHNELGWLRRAAIVRHLAQCPACCKELEIMEQTSHAIQDSETAAPALSDGLRNKILSNLPADNERKTLPPIELARLPRPQWQQWAAVGAVVCFTAFVVVPNIMGTKIKNTFNAAGNQMMDDGDFEDSSSDAPPPSDEKEPTFSVNGSGMDGKRVAEALAASPSAGSRGSGTRHLDGANMSFVDGHVKWFKPGQKPSANRASSPSVSLDQLESNSLRRSPAADTFSINGSADITPYRRVHKEGSLSVEVGDIESGSDAVEDTVKKAGGFIANNQLNTEANGVRAAALEIRIPIKEFDGVMKQIAGLGEVKAKKVTGEDITAQVSDVNEANNVIAGDLRTRMAQYQKAKDEAKKKERAVQNDWQYRNDIRQMRIALAQVRARLDYLKKLSDFANLSVQLREKPAGPNGGGFLGDAAKTGYTAWNSFLLAARLPMNLLIYILVYSPFWLPILLVWRHYNRGPQRRTVE